MGFINQLITGGHHPVVMTNIAIAMENPNHKWRFTAGKSINGPFSMAMLNNQSVSETAQGASGGGYYPITPPRYYHFS